MEKERVALHDYFSYSAYYLLIVYYYLIYTSFHLFSFLVYVANLATYTKNRQDF